MRKPFIAGNWKMHKTLADARALIKDIDQRLGRLDGASDVDVLICPPFTLLFPIAKAVADSPIMFGAQNVHEESQGAFTGEVSVEMLKDTGCTHVIVGHSERRQLFGEKNDRFARKVRAVTGAGLTVIYFVGATLADREGGKTRQVVDRQMSEVIGPDIPADRLVIAYEPVWAIGTGETATADQAQEVHGWIRGNLASTFDQATADRIRILYGGSVKPVNAAELLGQADIDGALVGGACLVSEDFTAIIAAAAARQLA